MNGATNEVIIGNGSLRAEPLFDAQTPPLRLEPKELPSRAAEKSLQNIGTLKKKKPARLTP